MGPDRAILKKAIADAEGNLSKAAALLGCTRQTLYNWIYSNELEKFAGIRPDRRAELDTRERLDTRPGPARLSSPERNMTNRGGAGRHTFSLVSSVAQATESDLVIQVSVKVKESLWQRTKLEAVRRRTTMGALVASALEAELSDEEAKPKAAKKEKA